jgi:hypothetical protein
MREPKNKILGPSGPLMHLSVNSVVFRKGVVYNKTTVLTMAVIMLGVITVCVKACGD